MKQIKLFAIALLCALSFTACSDDDNTPSTHPNNTYSDATAYVVCQGNFFGGGINGTLGEITSNFTYTDSIFSNVNDKSLGNTPQDAVAYGSKLYIAVYGSSVVFAVNRSTMKLEQELPIPSPRDIVADGKYVYVSSYEGNVIRIDTTSYDKTSVAVGPNPEEMVVANNKIYVVNSDGMNYPSMQNGKSVSVVDLSTFTETSKIPVGLNPTRIAADASGNVFLIAMGNYGDVPSKVQKISPDNSVDEDFARGTLMAIKDNKLYLVNIVSSSTITYQTINTVTGSLESEKFIGTDSGAEYPSGININPSNGDIYLLSDHLSASGYGDYSSPGYIKRYSSNGTLLSTIDTGIHPVSVVFNTK